MRGCCENQVKKKRGFQNFGNLSSRSEKICRFKNKSIRVKKDKSLKKVKPVQSKEIFSKYI